MIRLSRAACLASSLVLAPMAAAAQDAAASFDWGGAYVGGHAGWLWAKTDYVEPDDPQFGIDADLDGLAGGVLGGYSHQINRFVIGAEIDAGLADASFGSKDSGGNGYAGFDLGANAHIRARLGVAIDRTLLFVAGGLALARLTVDDTDPEFGKDDGTHAGWTIGGGVEHAVTDTLFLRVEYLYDDYGSESHSIAAPAGSPFFPAYEAETELTAHTLRAAVAYRF